MKKSSSRSQRGNKGIKGKHVLQICVLVGICIWLIYQIKYSHDKKKKFYEKDGKKSTNSLLESEVGLVKLGRKDLLPKEKDEEDEDENKNDEDEIDEQDQIKIADKDEIDEARDEHYKADDASSAVSHESRILNTEKSIENSNQEKFKIKKEHVLKLGETEKGEFMNNATTQVKDYDVESSEVTTVPNLEDQSQEDGAAPVGIFDLQTVSANITGENSIKDEFKNSSTLENIFGSNTSEEKENSEDENESDEKESSNLVSTEEEMEGFNDPQSLQEDIRIEGNEEDEEEEVAEE